MPLHYEMAQIKAEKKRFEEAVEHYGYCIQHLSVAEDDIMRATILKDAAMSHYALADYNQSLACLLQAETYLKPGKADSLRSSILDWTSVMYTNLGDYVSALDFQHQAMNIRQELGDSLGIASCYYTLGDIYSRQEEIKTAIDYFERSLAIAQRHQDQFLEYTCLASLANFNETIDQLDMCFYYSKQALALANALEYDYGKAYANNTLGNYYLKTGNVDSAELCFDTALELAQDFGDKGEQCVSLVGLANVHKQSRRFRAAEAYLMLALGLAQDHNERLAEIEIYEALAEMNFDRGNYKAAYESLRLKHGLKDSMISEDTRFNLANMQAGYQTEIAVRQLQSEKEAAILANQEQLVQTYKMAIAGGLAFIMIVAWLIYARQRSRRKHFRAMKHRNSIIAQQNETLRAYNEDLEHFTYAISHDLREPLNHVVTMGMLIEENVKRNRYEALTECASIAKKSAERMLTMLTSLLNYARLKDKTEATDAIAMDGVAQEALSNLNGTLEERKGQVEVGELPTIRANKEHMILLLQNLIGNGLKYNDSKSPVIKLSSERHNGHWQFCVEDNGQGIDPKYFGHVFGMFNRVQNNVAVKGSGMGLAMCKKIVERHKGKIWVESEPGHGSKFYFTMPAIAA